MNDLNPEERREVVAADMERLLARLAEGREAYTAADFDIITSQLKSLDTLPRAKRRKHRRFEMVCGGCEGILIEVMGTTPPVVRYRPPRDPQPLTMPRPDRRHLRRNDAWHYKLVDELDADDWLYTSCKCQQRDVAVADLVKFLDAGRRKVVIPPASIPTQGDTRRHHPPTM